MINIYKSINLFCPNSNEFLFDYIYILGYKNTASKDWKSRVVVLYTLKYLLRLKIIYIYSWCNNSELENRKMTITETIERIDNLWLENTEFKDYYGIVMFGTQKWYIEKLEELGMTHTTDWEWFVKNKIGDLEKWIEENRPKTSI